MSLIRISRARDGTLELRGRAWQEDGSLSARYWSEAVKERKEPFGRFVGRFLLLEGRTAPGPECTATGRDGRNPSGVRRSRGRYFTTRSEAPASVNPRTSGVYWRADTEDCAAIMDGNDELRRAELIAEQLRRWMSIAM